MTTQTEALKLALEAFETLTQYNMVRANIFRRFEPTCTGDYVDLREFREKAKPAITAIKEALAQDALQALHDENERLGLYKDAYAQPEQEPVAHFGSAYVNENGVHITTVLGPVAIPQDAKLYTTPPQRTWVGLTEREQGAIMEDLNAHGTNLYPFAQAIEAKLKEKNT